MRRIKLIIFLVALLTWIASLVAFVYSCFISNECQSEWQIFCLVAGIMGSFLLLPCFVIPSYFDLKEEW